MEGWASASCTACSAPVVEAYRSRGWGLVAEALSRPAVLEELTGLAELHAAAAEVLAGSEAAEAVDAGGELEGGGEGEEDEDWTEL